MLKRERYGVSEVLSVYQDQDCPTWTENVIFAGKPAIKHHLISLVARGTPRVVSRACATERVGIGYWSKWARRRVA